MNRRPTLTDRPSSIGMPSNRPGRQWHWVTCWLNTATSSAPPGPTSRCWNSTTNVGPQRPEAGLQRFDTVPPADPRSAVHDAVMRWAVLNMEGGNDPDHANFGDAIARVQSLSCELKLELSAGQSKTGRPMYGVSWLDDFHAFELTSEQTRQLDIEPGSVSIQGICGQPRGDIRLFPPTVRIDDLRFDDGGPLPSNVPITVQVRCDAIDQLPADTRLRIGYVVGAANIALSPPIATIAADGLLRKDLPPLTGDGWTEGPVPIFVDLVMVDGEPPDLRFTVVSNTLSALLDIRPAALGAGDPRTSVHDAVMAWAANNLNEGDDRGHAGLARAVADLQSRSWVLIAKMSGGASKTGRPMFAASWLDEFHSFELSDEQARQLDIESGAFSIAGRGQPLPTIRQSPPDATIEHLTINDGAPVSADAPIALTAKLSGRVPEAVRLRVGYVLDGISMQVSPPLEVSADGVARMTLEPLAQGGWFEGPVLMFVDLAVMTGEPNNPRFSVVSDTRAVMVDVARTSRTVRPDELRKAATRWCESAISGGPERVTAVSEAIDRILQRGNHFTLLLARGLSKIDTAYFVTSGAGGLFAYPITAEQAAVAGLTSDNVRLTATGALDDGGRAHIARLSGLMVASGALSSEGTAGIVFVDCPVPVSGDLMLRMTFTFVASTRVSAQPVSLPDNGVLVLEIPNPQEQPQEGPVLVAIDLCASHKWEGRLAPVSNTVAVLLDVLGDPAPAAISLAPQRDSRADLSEAQITLQSEDGSSYTCQILDVFDFEGGEYAVLNRISEDPDDDGLLVIMRIVEGGNDAVFRLIDDDAEFDRVVAHLERIVQNGGDDIARS